MSKLARRPISITDVDATFDGSNLIIKGKHGELKLYILPDVKLDISGSDQSISISSENPQMLGLFSTLIRNMVQGVLHQFNEELVLKGVGYRVSLSKNELNFNLGYSHPVSYVLPESIKAEVKSPTEISIIGIDKQMVGQVAAEIIKLRPARKDPYKEKGIKRVRDRIIKKVGKKVK